MVGRRAATLVLGAAVTLASLAWTVADGAASGASAAPAAASEGPNRTILTMALTGVVDPFMASYIERGIHTAESNGDVAVMITIDTPGGLDSSMRSIVQAILGTTLPVICYTSPSGARAASAGTFIMLGCPVNAMAPGTNIGAAHPVGVTGAVESEKVTNDAVAYFRSLAERWHRNADWAERAVRDASSLTADAALSERVVDWVAPSASALLQDIGGCGTAPPPVPSTGLGRVPAVCDVTAQALNPSLTESLFHSFADPNVAFLLLSIGFLALIAWVFHPGFHASLAVGIICIILGFLILETLPVRLSGVLLIAVAAILFVVDVKAQTHGVLTAAAIGVLVLGGLLLFNPTLPGGAHVSIWLIVLMAILFALFSATVLRAVLRAKQRPVQGGLEGLVGTTGIALTALKPTGQVRLLNETWTAEAESGRIAAGGAVRVIAVKGVKLIVEPAAAHAPSEIPAPAHEDGSLSAAGTSAGAEREGT
jgi:membrane-bound serine protease (ClpP class)